MGEDQAGPGEQAPTPQGRNRIPRAVEHAPGCESWQWEPEDRAGTCTCGVGGHVELVEEVIYNENTKHQHPSDAKAEMAKHGLEARHEVDFMQPGMTIDEAVAESLNTPSHRSAMHSVRQYLRARKQWRRGGRVGPPPEPPDETHDV